MEFGRTVAPEMSKCPWENLLCIISSNIMYSFVEGIHLHLYSWAMQILKPFQREVEYCLQCEIDRLKRKLAKAMLTIEKQEAEKIQLKTEVHTQEKYCQTQDLVKI